MKRKTFWGNDDDYGYPYNHKYEEVDSDRGATDEELDKTSLSYQNRLIQYNKE